MRKIQKQSAKHTCMQCVHASPIMENWNLDYVNHAPICYRCPFIEERAVIRNETACDKFREK